MMALATQKSKVGKGGAVLALPVEHVSINDSKVHIALIVAMKKTIDDCAHFTKVR